MKHIQKKGEEFSVEKVMAEFRESEERGPRQSGRFKINVPFNDAVDRTLEVKPRSAKAAAHR